MPDSAPDTAACDCHAGGGAPHDPAIHVEVAGRDFTWPVTGPAPVAADGPRNPLLAQSFTALWHDLNMPDADLLRLLTNATCPIVCKNHRTDDEPDWHEECEDRAREAFRILRGWVKPDA